MYADKYLIAMVIVYFKRANYHLSEYTVDNFFIAMLVDICQQVIYFIYIGRHYEILCYNTHS